MNSATTKLEEKESEFSVFAGQFLESKSGCSKEDPHSLKLPKSLDNKSSGKFLVVCKACV